jgi:subtilisin-like proprotein convertase family protein
MILQFNSLEYEVCQPDDLDIPFSFETSGGFSEEVSFSVAGAPAALGIAFSPDIVMSDTDPVTLSITNTDQVPSGNYPLAVTATSATESKVVLLQVQILDGTFSPVTLSSPANGASDTSVSLQLEWIGDPSFTTYDLEIATDTGFANIVESANVIFNRYLPTTLQESTTYYWRVKPENNCGEGPFSAVSSFSTVSVNCQGYTADNLPLAISAIGTPTIESVITVSDDLTVADVNVGVNIEHTFVGDLIITLISPSGTEVVLTSNFCGESGNIDAVFDDDGNPFVCGSNPAIGGLVKPPGSLASFNGESSQGQWILRVFDSAPADGGSLNDFSLDLCVEGQFRPDADGDGVFDDGDDLCLGTPPGTEVTLDGCPVYRFAADTFTLAIQSESCIPSNNGSIEVTAVASMDYSITVQGPGTNITEDFTKAYLLGPLSAGVYSLCITGTDGSMVYEAYCFDAVVSEPQPLSVSSRLIADGRQVVLELSGSEVYLVELNGVTRQISGPEAVLDLKEGANSLKVNTLQPCQGTYEEVLVTRQPVVFPNPFYDELSVFLGVDGEVKVWIFSVEGRQLEQRTYQVSGGELVLDFRGRAPGMYLLKVEAEALKGTYKVVKR